VHQAQGGGDMAVAQRAQPASLTRRLRGHPEAERLHEQDLGESGDEHRRAMTTRARLVGEQSERPPQPSVGMRLTGAHVKDPGKKRQDRVVAAVLELERSADHVGLGSCTAVAQHVIVCRPSCQQIGQQQRRGIASIAQHVAGSVGENDEVPGLQAYRDAIPGHAEPRDATDDDVEMGVDPRGQSHRPWGGHVRDAEDVAPEA